MIESLIYSQHLKEIKTLTVDYYLMLMNYSLLFVSSLRINTFLSGSYLALRSYNIDGIKKNKKNRKGGSGPPSLLLICDRLKILPIGYVYFQKKISFECRFSFTSTIAVSVYSVLCCIQLILICFSISLNSVSVVAWALYQHSLS